MGFEGVTPSPPTPTGMGTTEQRTRNTRATSATAETPAESDENLTRSIHGGEVAGVLAQLEAAFMALSEADQASFLDHLPKLRRS